MVSHAARFPNIYISITCLRMALTYSCLMRRDTMSPAMFQKTTCRPSREANTAINTHPCRQVFLAHSWSSTSAQRQKSFSPNHSNTLSQAKHTHTKKGSLIIKHVSAQKCNQPIRIRAQGLTHNQAHGNNGPRTYTPHRNKGSLSIKPPSTRGDSPSKAQRCSRPSAPLDTIGDQFTTKPPEHNRARSHQPPSTQKRRLSHHTTKLRHRKEKKGRDQVTINVPETKATAPVAAKTPERLETADRMSSPFSSSMMSPNTRMKLGVVRLSAVVCRRRWSW